MTKIATLSALIFASINTNATIITGDLSYDDKLTHTITGKNGLTYIGWAEAAAYNYQQTLNATRVGGKFEGYHIANQVEAAEFFTLATGVSVTDGYGTVRANSPIDKTAFGDLPSSSGVWYLIDLNRGRNDVGILSLSGQNSYVHNPYMEIRTTAFAYNIAHTDRHSESGSVSSRLRSWLLVSGPTPIAHPIPAPLTPLLFALGVIGSCFVSKKNIFKYLDSKNKLT